VYEITYRAPTLRAKGLFASMVLLLLASWSSLAILFGIRVGAGVSGFVGDFVVTETREEAALPCSLYMLCR